MTSEKKVGKGNALVHKSNQPLIQKEAPPRGLEAGSDREDLVLPRVKLLQPLSPEVQEGGLRPGTMINSVSGEKIPTDEFIPILLTKSFTKFIPREKGGGIEWRTNNPLDPRVQDGIKFGPNGEKPEVVASLDYISVLGDDFNFPIIISFSKTSYRGGRKLYSMARLSRQDLFAFKYRLLTKKVSNDKGIYWTQDLELASKTSPDEFKRAEELYKALAPQREKIQAHVEESAEDPI